MTPGDRSADRSDEEALREHLAELETVLSRLRSDLSEESRTRNRVPRPPSPTELLRFTERYTLPALIALLEATIRSLELLRATLRVADPDRRLDAVGDGSHGRLADVRDGTTAGVRRTLSELRTALSETDLPQEATSRELLEDARELSAEIDDLLAGDRESTPTGGSHGSDRTNDGDGDGEDGFKSTDAGRAGRNEGISIDVHDPDAPDASGDRSSTLDAEEETDEGEDSAPEIDVDAELASIKQELDEDDENGTENDDERARDDDAASDDSDGRAESNDPNDADDGIGESADSTDSDDIAGSDDIADPNDADDSDEPVD
ncbi:hypothetical protein ACERIT_02230 [Halopenitus sp. H-Gu1]|uniref:DUF7547 family protein n=1 Tax=Halopenitus sp. H-Gu1 TaxID=3242697 RepID=UPI00359DF287